MAYAAALIASARQADYLRFLGFRRRAVVPGYDSLARARVWSEGGSEPAPGGLRFAERPFVFVGRFVAKKNLFVLLEAFAWYRSKAGARARRLVLVGGGELDSALRARIAELGLDDAVELTGFLPRAGVAAHLSRALALVLPSSEEQWGLVVNEALAFHLPVIVSEPVGARDALVRNLVNGFVVEPGSVAGWAEAMALLAFDESLFRRHALFLSGRHVPQLVEQQLEMRAPALAPHVVKAPLPLGPDVG